MKRAANMSTQQHPFLLIATHLAAALLNKDELSLPTSEFINITVFG